VDNARPVPLIDRWITRVNNAIVDVGGDGRGRERDGVVYEG
jgi:hypothetical protein